MKLFQRAERSSILIRCPCVRKSQEIGGGERSPPTTARLVHSASPPKPTAEIGKEGVFCPEALIRYIPPSLTRLSLVDPLRSCYVAGYRKRGKKSALPFALLLWYRSV